MDIKVGDTVRRVMYVEPHNEERGMRMGQEYTVTDIDVRSRCLKVEGVGRSWLMKHFVKVTKEKKAMDIKVGDTVRRTAVVTSYMQERGMKRGQDYIVKSLNVDDGTFTVEGAEGNYMIEYFEKVRRKDMNKDTYEFVVPCESAVSRKEVEENLSRSKPVAIVKRDDGYCTLVLHDSLRYKLECMEPTEAAVIKKALAPFDINPWVPIYYLNEGISAVKAIKAGRIAHKREHTITVEILEI